MSKIFYINGFQIGDQYGCGQNCYVNMLDTKMPHEPQHKVIMFSEYEKLQAENKKLRECVEFIAGYVNGIQAVERSQKCLKELDK